MPRDKAVELRHKAPAHRAHQAPPNLREWHITLDFLGLCPLDQAYTAVSERTDPIESFHQAVNSKVRDIFFALYRDFPDPHRVTGQEKF